MATRLTNEQKDKIFSLLKSDRASNFGSLQAILSTIIANRTVTIFTEDKTKLVLSPQEAWEVVAEWGKSSEGNLPVDMRGQSTHSLASHLLNYIKSHIVGQTEQATAAYYAMLEQAKQGSVRAPVATTKEADRYQKAQDLRRQMFDAINDKFLGKLSTELEKTKFLQRIQDPRTRSMVAAFLAANSANLRREDQRLAEKVNQLLLSRAGDGSINNVIHLAYATSVDKNRELQEIIAKVNEQITKTYGIDSQAYLADQEKLRALSALAPSLNDIPALINQLAPHATASQKSAIAAALRKNIVLAARGQHQGGGFILSRAFDQANLQGDPASLAALTPVIEEIEMSTRQRLLGGGLFERNRRILATYGVAANAGVDPTIPWTRANDLQAIEKYLLRGTKYKNAAEALEAELGSQHPDITQIGKLRALLAHQQQYALYQNRLGSDPLFAFQNLLAKTNSAVRTIREPYDKTLSAVLSAYGKVDDVINWPARTLTNVWEKAVEKTSIPIGKNGYRFSFADIPGSVYSGWIELQKNVATRIAVWASSFEKTTGITGFIIRQIGEFSSSFVKADAHWSQAGFLFFEKKWGNVLDWTAQKIFKEKSFAALQAGIVRTIQAAGNKVAAGLGDKIASTIGAATSGAGVGLVILGLQILWETGKGLFGKFKNWLSSIFHGDADNLFGLSGILMGVANFVTFGIPAMIAGAVEALKVVIKKVGEYIILLIMLAGAASLIILLFISLVFRPYMDSTGLDSGMTPLASIVCNLAGTDPNSIPVDPQASQAGQSTLVAAQCIYDLLEKFNINPLLASNATGGAWAAFSGALGNAEAASIIQTSAVGQGAFQCVGYIAGIGAMIGRPFNPINACSYVNNPPPGFTWTTRPKVGCFFAIGSSNCSSESPGHVGLVRSVKGAIVDVMDANYGVTGGVRVNGQFPTSEISGYMCP